MSINNKLTGIDLNNIINWKIPKSGLKLAVTYFDILFS